MKSNPPEPGKESSWPLAVTIAVALPILYVLSIGPAAALVDRYPGLEAPMTVLYGPVIFLIDKTPLGAPLIVYVELFV